MDTWRETDRKKTNTCKTTKQVDGLAPTTKAKASPAWAKARQRQGQRQGQRQEQRTRENTTARKGRKDSTEWRSTTTRKTHQPVKITQNGRTGVGITLTSGMTQTGGQTIGAQICGLTLHGYKRHDSCHRRNLLNNSPIQHTEAAFQC